MLYKVVANYNNLFDDDISLHLSLRKAIKSARKAKQNGYTKPYYSFMRLPQKIKDVRVVNFQGIVVYSVIEEENK
jgi:hypothetical protein